MKAVLKLSMSTDLAFWVAFIVARLSEARKLDSESRTTKLATLILSSLSAIVRRLGWHQCQAQPDLQLQLIYHLDNDVRTA